MLQKDYICFYAQKIWYYGQEFYLKENIMKNDGLVKELFYFQPENYNILPAHVDSVHLLGEFNAWGEDEAKLENYGLFQDRTGRWAGVFEVKEGREPYKFLVNHTTYCPDTGEIYYSTVKTCKWARKAIWYQIFPDRFNKSSEKQDVLSWDAKPNYFDNFGGDLKGIEQKLDYFKSLYGDLNNFALYLNPINLSTASNHKYWPEDFAKIDPQFGTEADLKNLIDALHSEGGKLILDLVYNHSGINHPAFIDVLRNGSESKYFDWYRGISLNEKEKIEIPVLQFDSHGHCENITIENDPRKGTFDAKKESYFDIWNGKYRFPINNPASFNCSDIAEMLENQPYYRLINIDKRPNYTCWFEFFEIPELNGENPELKRHLFDCAKKWIRLGVDGFRLDVPDMLNDAHKFWADFREMVNEELWSLGKKPQDFYILGEIWTNDEITNSFLNSNPDSFPKRFDAIMNYPIREVIINFLSGEILEPRSDRVKFEDEISVSELDSILHKNFENISFNTDRVQFNCFSTHDTRRLRSVLEDMKMLKTAVSMQFTLIGAPTIYYGDEIGMQGGVDPDNRGTMNWNIVKTLEQCPNANEIFSHYKTLIKIRNERRALSHGLMLTLLVNDVREIYAYSRFSDDGDCVIVVVSKYDVSEDIIVDLTDTPFEYTKKWKSAFGGDEFINSNGKIIISPEQIVDNNLILLN